MLHPFHKVAPGRLQHYVPRLHTKRFALKDSAGHCRLFDVRTSRYWDYAAWRNQMADKDFYGTKGLDDVLGVIEQKATPILDSVVQDSRLPSSSSTAEEWLYLFVTTLSSRTRASAEKLSKILGDGVKEVMSLDATIGPLIKDLTVRLTDPQVLSVVSTLEIAWVARDLACKLVVNDTELPFVSSDSPVIKCNQWAEFRRIEGDPIGLASKGLQMLLPLSPRVLLMIYDSDVYRVGGKRGRTCNATLMDVRLLNALQFIEAESLIVGSDALKEEYFVNELAAAKVYRSRPRSATVFYETDDPLRTIFRQLATRAGQPLELSFCKLTDKARRQPLQDFVVQLRDERLRGMKRPRVARRDE